MQKDSISQTGFFAVAFERRRGAIWGLLFLFWFALGVFSAGAPFIELPQIRRPVPPSAGLGLIWRMFLSQFAIWLSWVALVPVVLWMRRRFPLERSALWRTLLLHLLAIAALCLAHAGITLLLTDVLGSAGQGPPLTIRLTYWWTRDLAFCGLFYGLVLGISSALDYYRQFRERELRASQLETQLAQAELQMLKMQLHPHFLFNTLNGITGMVRDNDNAAAVQMLVGLSELLRRTLDNSGKQEVALGEELEWLELYLKLQQMRFSDRLQVSMNAAPETLDVQVPNLILQPLVENAIRHGLASRAAPGRISLTAQLVNERLELCVCDDGIGLPDGWSLENCAGLGLKNTRARLRQLYANDFQLKIQDREAGGVEAWVSIPLRKDASIDRQS
ncbi:MAG: histidine kinase [Acidobacteria bacterium]|nr:histidine kinase [Acidobacteriota bacterium]